MIASKADIISNYRKGTVYIDDKIADKTDNGKNVVNGIRILNRKKLSEITNSDYEYNKHIIEIKFDTARFFSLGLSFKQNLVRIRKSIRLFILIKKN